MAKICIAIIVLLLLTGCATCPPCPKELTWSYVELLPSDILYLRDGKVTLFVSIPRGRFDLERGYYTDDQVAQLIQHLPKLTLGALCESDLKLRRENINYRQE